MAKRTKKTIQTLNEQQICDLYKMETIQNCIANPPPIEGFVGKKAKVDYILKQGIPPSVIQALVEALIEGRDINWDDIPHRDAGAVSILVSTAEKRRASIERPSKKGVRRAAKLATDGKIIHLLVEKNPKRAGSKSYDRFECYREGMTVGQAIAAGVTRGDIKWDQEHGHIELKDENTSPEPMGEESLPAEPQVSADSSTS